MAEHVRFEALLNKKFLGEHDLPEEGAGDMIVEIADVRQEEVQNATGKEVKTVIHFTGNIKPMIANTTNMKRIASVAGSRYIDEWIGVKIQLYREMVSSFGSVVPAIRVREFAPKA